MVIIKKQVNSARIKLDSIKEFTSMKKVIKTLVVLLVLGITCDVSAQSSYLYTSDLSESKNYVRAVTAKGEGLDLSSSSLDAYEVDEVIQYYDGLGRPLQTVQVAASTTHHDIVSHTFYDEFGREAERYLPFSTVLDNYNHGSLVQSSTVIVDQQDYYSNYGQYTDRLHAFSETEYEASPLNRILSETGSGKSWHDNEKAVNYAYKVHDTEDYAIPQCVVNSSNVFDLVYLDQQLYVNSTTDEDGNKMETITDLQGQVIMKRSYLSEFINDCAVTYYVYDDYNNLRLVVQPAGWEQLRDQLSGGANVQLIANEEFVSQYCFYYEYDHRNRMIEKQVPGAAPVYMVYDKRDRLVLTQDGNQRSVTDSQILVDGVNEDLYGNSDEGTSYRILNGGTVTLKVGFESASFYAGEAVANDEWSFTKYDALNRPVMTGVVALSASVDDIREAVELMTDYSITYTGSSDRFGYDNSSYPSVTDAEILTVTYYDNYAFTGDDHWSLGNYTSESLLHGLATGSKVRVLDGEMLESITLYDDELRPIEVHVENHLEGKDVVVTEYRNEVNSEVVSTEREHSENATHTITATILDEFGYDHTGRLLQTATTIDQGTPSVVTQEYNEIGQLVEKDLNGAQSVDYAYNIRGWLKTINGGTTFDDTSDKFGMKLEYDEAGLYNGNIGSVAWKNVGSEAQEFNYSYDKLNRLTAANYGFVSGSTTYEDYFSVSGLQYDLNGNIKRLNRRYEGQSVDELVYDYQGNQLVGVEDASGNDELFDNGHIRPSNQQSNTIFLNNYDPDNVNGQEVQEYVFNYSWDFVIASGMSDIEVAMDMCITGYSEMKFTLELYDAADPLNPVDTQDWIKATNVQTSGSPLVCESISFVQSLSLLSQGGTAKLIVSGENQNAYWTEVTMKNVELTTKTSDVVTSAESEYFYDANGNMTEDLNKNITNIRYNYLNLPEKVDYVKSNGDSHTVTYTYDAAGMKLKKESTEGATIDYVGGIHYRDGVLDFVQHAEGRYLFGTSAYEYNLTDHLGNVRATVNASDSVVQSDDYMPFGLSFNSYTSGQENLYKYNGKEEQKETGWYHYGARMYDPAIGRWNHVDPLADIYYDLSPYCYVANNPTKYIDPDGRFIGTLIGTVVGSAAGAYDSYSKGGDVWAGAAEGAVSGAIAGAAVDAVVALTVATGGIGTVIVAGAAAGAAGGALGAIAGDAVGQVVTDVNQGSDVSTAVKNISSENFGSKAATGAITGAIGGAIGGGVGKALKVAEEATSKVLKTTMAESMESTAKVIRGLGAESGASQSVINANVSTMTTTMSKGMSEATKATTSSINKISAGTGMGTESMIKVVQEHLKED